MARHFFFAPIVLPLYNARQAQRFVVGAAAQKVAGMAAAVRTHGLRPVIVSSPIVTASRGRFYFGGFAGRDARLACMYLPAISVRGLNRLFSSFCYLWFACRHVQRHDVVVLYNYFPEYIPLAAWLRWRCGRSRVVLDLEDGPRADEKNLRGRMNRWSLGVLKRLCSERTIVVSHKVAQAMALNDVCVINGVCADVGPRTRAFGTPILFLYGGTIESATGLDLFDQAVRRFAHTHRELAGDVRFIVSGFGGAAQVAALARDVAPAGVRVDVCQDLGPAEYRQLLEQADVGLSLKMPDNEMGATTFPSKVIELASHGLLVLTTDVSDVSLLFDANTAVVLRNATPDELASCIAAIAYDPDRYSRIAEDGKRAIGARCGRHEVGAQLAGFLGSNVHPSTTTPMSGSHSLLQALRFPLANAILGALPATRLFGAKRALLRWLGFDLAAGCRIAGGVRFYGRGRVTIGADTWIGLDCTFVVAPDGPITIGARCDIAPQTLFHTGSHMLGDARRRAGAGYSSPIDVRDGSWIGTRSTLLGGALLGVGTVVASGALVRPGEYPPNVLLAGAPALIKRGLA